MTIQSKFETLLNKFTKPSDLAGPEGHKIAETGNYEDLSGKPTKVSDFTNDGVGDASGGFITADSGTANPETIHDGLTPGPSEDTTYTLNRTGSAEKAETFSATAQSFSVPYFTVDAKGRVTSFTNRTVSLNTVNSTNNYNNYYNYTNYMNYNNYYSYSNYRSYRNNT